MLTSNGCADSPRLDALERYDILDTAHEVQFDDVTRLVQTIFDVPMSTITFVDGHRQWFKSRQGLAMDQTDRGPAFCTLALRETAPLVVEDTLLDPRFASNPLVLGEPHLRFYAGAQIRTPDGVPIGTVCAMDRKPRRFDDRDRAVLVGLAGLVAQQLELRLQAASDPLTGALTRAAFREEANRQIGLGIRHRHAVSCIAIDLDHFKTINDTFGHGVGDQVLVDTIAACRSRLRLSDVLASTGGEEFVVVLPHTGNASALAVAEKLRSAIQEQVKVADHPDAAPITASFGVASLGRDAKDLETLLAQADHALYAAKAQGRNRVCGWEPAVDAASTIRRRVLKAGRIAFNGGRSSIDCTIRSLSASEAGFDVISSAGVPDRFKLQVGDGSLSRLCHVISKRNTHIEVRFE